MPVRKPYSSDLSDEEYAIIEECYRLWKNPTGGRPPSKHLRELWNALFYVVKNGCFWRDLPHDFGFHWKRVYNFFSKLKHSGRLEIVMHALRERLRIKEGKHPCPSLGIIDAQSVKSCSFLK